MNRVVMAILAAYQRWVSPVLPPACRFHPTCSEYARLSFEKYGFFRATFMSTKRILKCHPLHPGGVDQP
jgi:putative membrane protein insertion efficiency factor